MDGTESANYRYSYGSKGVLWWRERRVWAGADDTNGMRKGKEKREIKEKKIGVRF